MKEPVWVNEDVVVSIHKRQIAEHGGDAGIRAYELLESALAKPKNRYFYSDPKAELAALAASYAFGIARNHPFIDGNKRTAFVACFLFLKLNGVRVSASQLEKYAVFMKLAAGEISEEELSEWLSKHTN